LINGVRAETLDLASFEIDPDSRGKGLFTEMLGLIEKYAWENDLTIFVENVHNTRLRDFLIRRGYETGEAEILCYYRSKPE
jgi:GNAT superfamily N-acetyltransferase